MAVEFGLLGDLQVRIEGRAIDIGHPRQRAVLLALLVDANRAVSVDRLIERIWGEQEPTSARNAVYSYVSRLRKVLSDAGVKIERRHRGYLLAVDPIAVDMHQFADLVKRARKSVADVDALELLEQALGLWRGSVFTGVDTPWMQDLRTALERDRLAAELDRNDIRLRLGGHADLVADLAKRSSEYPLDERLAGQLMLALYRSGSQAAAINRLHELRRMLATELGTNPSPQLRDLYQRILAFDPGLDVRWNLVPVPLQMPAAPQRFVGRALELEVLDRFLDDANGVWAVSTLVGGGGVGKTALALAWAHRRADQFSEGQLFVNLRGFDPAGPPMPVATALRILLDALGAAPGEIPIDLHAQASLYRSMVAGRRLLIVLDNARDSAQVEPLLPGSPACMVLVTSRNQLIGLVSSHGAAPTQLDVLEPHEAHELLACYLSPAREAAEPAAIDQLVAHSAGLPLALTVIGARAATHPALPLRALANELRSATDRLDALDAGELNVNVRTVFACSYDALTTDAAHVFGLLGLAPGPDLSLSAAVSLCGWVIRRTRSALRALEGMHLTQEQLPGRYRMHDLLRLFAAERAPAGRASADANEALHRLVDFYVHTACSGDRLLDANRTAIELGRPRSGVFPWELTDRVAAIDWFDAEHPNLLAAQQLAESQGWDHEVWKLGWGLSSYHMLRGHLHAHLATAQAGLAATQRIGDPTLQTAALARVGLAQVSLDEPDQAITQLRQALTMHEDAGDRFGQAKVQGFLSWAWETKGDLRQALTHARNSISLYQFIDEPVWEAKVLNTAGWYHAQLGEYGPARELCQQALAILRCHASGDGQAHTLDSLAYIAHHTGDFARAQDLYTEALTLFREMGDSYEEADTLVRLGDSQRALDQTRFATKAWLQALHLYKTQDRRRQVAEVQRRLASCGYRDFP